MKQLYINNKRVIIDSEGTYFPFSYKINDLENVNIIGVPVSKTIEIPRCPINDEVFGYIGELTRITIGGTDNYIGVSFNQTKKAYYELYNDSELISEGTISIVDVTTNNYSILLYDILIDKVESIAGNADTGTGYLNELDIILSNNSTFSIEAYSSNVKTLIDTKAEVKPCVNIKEYTSTGTDSYINVNTVPAVHTLPSEMTPVQFQTLKPYEFEYSLPISTVFRSINDKYDLITYEEDLDVLFDEVHFNCGSPKSILTQENYIVNGTTFTYFRGYTDRIQSVWTDAKKKMLFTDDGTNIGQKNGNYYLEVPLFLDIININGANEVQPTKTLTSFVTDWEKFNNLSGAFETYCNNFYGGTHPNAAPYGTYLGSLWVDINIGSYSTIDGTKLYSSKPITTEIRLLKDVNVIETLNLNGDIIKLNVQHPNGKIVLTYDYYVKTQGVDVVNYIEYDFSNIGHNLNSNNGVLLFTELIGNSYVTPGQLITPSIGNIITDYKSIDFRSGELLNGQTLFPKIPIKDFLIETVKYFNLGIRMVDGKLNLHYKRYYETSDILKVNALNSIDINNFNFSKLTFKNEVSTNKWIEEYNTYTKKTYGEKTINTGYNIKVTNKDLSLSVSSPAIIRDVEKWAYDIFASYFNGGYSKHLNGITEGLEDKLVFGYPLNIIDDLYTINDTQYEAGLISATIIPIETKFLLSNTSLNYNTSNGLYTFSGIDDILGSRLLDNHFTLVPYKFDSNYNVVKSVEINKPLYNYANITDELYPESVTLYTRYHQRYIQDMYNVNTHILNINVYIDGLIDEYKIYNYNNSKYIISEVPEYDPTTPNLYDIKLLRVNDVTNYTDFYGKVTKTVPIILTNDASSISYISIGFGGTIESDGNSTITEKGLLLAYPGDSLDYDNWERKVSIGTSTFFSYITGLQTNTEYIYRTYATNAIGVSYGEIKLTQTLSSSTPLIDMTYTDYVYSTSADVSSEIIYQGDSAVTSRGFCWDTYPSEPTLSSNLGYSTNGSGIGVFSHTITGLNSNTDYNIIAYGTNAQGTNYSEIMSTITTEPGVPMVTISHCIRQLPTMNDGVCSGEIINDGALTITGTGFVYSKTNTMPTLADGVKSSTDLEGVFGATINGMSGMPPAYYIRAYATNSAGTGYSTVINDTI